VEVEPLSIERYGDFTVLLTFALFCNSMLQCYCLKFISFRYFTH